MKNKTHRINGVKFMLDDQGYVSANNGKTNQIGHIEECIQVAQSLHELFAICDEIKASQENAQIQISLP